MFKFSKITVLVIAISFAPSIFTSSIDELEAMQEQSCARRAAERVKTASLCAFGAFKWALSGTFARALKVHDLRSALDSVLDFVNIPLKSLKVGLYEMAVPWLEPFELENSRFTCPITDKDACVVDENTKDHVLATYKLMRDIHKAFKKAGVPYFAMSGTLLGAVRHGGFIPWDDDLDISVTEEFAHAIPKVLQILEKKGYKTFTSKGMFPSIIEAFKLFNNGELNDPAKVSGIFGGSFTGWRIERWFDRPSVDGKETVPFCDIFLMEKACDRYHYVLGWPEFSAHQDDIYPLKEVKFGKYKILAPKNHALFLDAEYPNWPKYMQKYGHGYGNCQVDLKRFSAPIEKMRKKDYLPAGPFIVDK